MENENAMPDAEKHQEAVQAQPELPETKETKEEVKVEAKEADTAPNAEEAAVVSAEEDPATTTEATSTVNTEETAEEGNEGAENLASEEPEEEVVEEEEQIDFHQLDKQQLVDFIVELNKESDMRRVDRLLKEIRPRFDERFREEKEAALAKFMEEEGADADDFQFKGGELDIRFNDYFNLLRDKRNQFYRQLENQKDENLKTKTSLLDKLRHIIDDEEHVDIKVVKEIQEQWKAVGPVPASQNKLLWANYNALLDRYYDSRSIYFELKELDRKKNYDAKVELCEKAEALAAGDNLKEAVTQLNELHEEYKHIGPVPRDLQEDLWQRFKAASDKVYEHRKEYVGEMKKELQANLEQKVKLADSLSEFLAFESDRISEWNKKTKELLALQKQWEAIGGMPREKAKEVNKLFWNGFKKFFANKSAFFKTFESQREDNLKLKQELVKRAKELAGSDQWDKTADALKNLQSEWRDLGPVPDKYRNSVYAEFKAACDEFFERRRNKNQEQNKVFEDNMKQKMALCDQLGDLAKADAIAPDDIYALTDAYFQIGFVPRKAIRKMNGRFDAVIDEVLNAKGLADDQRGEVKMNIDLGKMSGGAKGDQKSQRQEGAIKRKISTLESDINTWTTNMDFFASSKNADKLKEEFIQKIDQAKQELEALKGQLRILRNR